MTWWPLATAVGVSVLVIAIGRIVDADRPVVGFEIHLRFLALVLAAAAASALHDPAAATLAPVPARPAFRLAIRIGITFVAWAGCWTALVVVVTTADGTVAWTATVEAVGWLCLATAAAVVADTSAVAPVLLVVVVAATVLRDHVALLDPFNTPISAARARDWAILFCLSAIAIAYAGRDAARPRIVRPNSRGTYRPRRAPVKHS